MPLEPEDSSSVWRDSTWHLCPVVKMIQQQGCSGEDSGRCRLETVAHCSPPGCVGSYSQSIWQILVGKWDSEKGNRCSPYWYTLVYTLVCMLSSSVMTGSFVTPQTIALHAPLPMVFSSQVYWSGLLFPPPGILLTQGLNLCLLYFLHWQVDSLPLRHQGTPHLLTRSPMRVSDTV